MLKQNLKLLCNNLVQNKSATHLAQILWDIDPPYQNCSLVPIFESRLPSKAKLTPGN